MQPTSGDRTRFSSRQRMCTVLLAITVGLSPVAASVTIQPLGIQRLSNGNTLIADCRVGSEARALEVDSLGRLVWAYVKGDVSFLHTARRVADNTLMSASYAHKVIEVDRDGDVVWAGPLDLDYPNEAYRLANGNTLITDRDNPRVIEVTPQLMVVWSYTNLSGPHNGRRLANGHTLIGDSGDDRVVEVDSAGNVVWQYSTSLSWPRYAQRLSDSNTLITDSDNNRVIEVNPTGQVVWSATGPLPYEASRLDNGNTLVSIISSVVELTPADSIVWQYPNTVSVLVETLQVVNPSTGCSLCVHIHRPAYAGPLNRIPGIVFVPGGTGFGSSYDSAGLPDNIASDGFALLHFDPDGRGLSGPYPENYDGYAQQDGMHACLESLASRDYVDTNRLGIYSTGYGITMASGMLARHAGPPVKFLLDFEGPADRSQTCLDSGGFVPVPADSEAFWQEREAARFMKQVPAAYLRMQCQVDSNPILGDNRHAIQLIDSATAELYGGAGISAWTRVNDSVMNQSNRVYTMSYPPVWIPELQEPQNDVRILLYLHELAGSELTGAAEFGATSPAAALSAYPRPCRGVLRVGLTSGSVRELTVHDVCGRLVKRGVLAAGQRQAELDLRDVQPGVYYLSAAGAGTVPVVVVR